MNLQRTQQEYDRKHEKKNDMDVYSYLESEKWIRRLYIRIWIFVEMKILVPTGIRQFESPFTFLFDFCKCKNLTFALLWMFGGWFAIMDFGAVGIWRWMTVTRL